MGAQARRDPAAREAGFRDLNTESPPGCPVPARGYTWVGRRGRGSSVGVDLASRTASVPGPGAGSAGRLTVLVAEDDEAMRDVVCEVLRSRGYRVLSARDGTEGISLAESEDLQFDLLVADEVMPGATGTALAQRARLRWARVPVLLISGQALDVQALMTHLGPLVAFLRKPFTPRGLLGDVDGLLARGAHEVV